MEENNLAHLEKWIEEKHRKIVDEYVEYQEVKPFQFLPGHRSLILGIKEEISSMQDVKKKKVTKKLPPVEDEQSLAHSLTNQLSSYANGIGLKLNWALSIQNIQLQSTENTTVAHCTISCPICFNDYSVRYDRNWKVANMYRHLRTHIKNPPNVHQNMNKTIEILSIETLDNQDLYLNSLDSDILIEHTGVNGDEMMNELV